MNYEQTLTAFFFKELEGTLEEFYQTLPEPPGPIERLAYQRATNRLRNRCVIEGIGHLNRFMNYRITEVVLWDDNGNNPPKQRGELICKSL